MKYSLSLKCGSNNYLPIEWDLFPDYENQDINTLESIDAYTSKMSEEDLRYTLLQEFGYDTTEQKMVINYFDGKMRELEYGLCFEERKMFLNTDFVLECIKENKTDKVFLNRIYNAFKTVQEKSPAFNDLLTAINSLTNENELSNIYYIDYLELRSLGMFISTLLPHKLNKNNKEVVIDEQLSTSDIIIKKELTKETE